MTVCSLQKNKDYNKIILNQLKTQEIYLVRVHNPFDKNAEKSCLLQIHIKYANN